MCAPVGEQHSGVGSRGTDAGRGIAVNEVQTHSRGSLPTIEDWSEDIVTATNEFESGVSPEDLLPATL